MSIQITNNEKKFEILDTSVDGIANVDFVIESTGDAYSADNYYDILYDTTKYNRIIFMVGMPVEIEMFDNIPTHIVHKHLGKLDMDTFSIIQTSKQANDIMTFFDEATDRIIYRRLYLEMTGDTYFDPAKGAICHPNNTPTIKVSCVDNTEEIFDDVTTIRIKNMKEGSEDSNWTQMTFNDQPVDVRTIDITNGAEVKIGLLSEVRNTIRLKAVIPGIDDIWLTAYPEFERLV